MTVALTVGSLKAGLSHRTVLPSSLTTAYGLSDSQAKTYPVGASGSTTISPATLGVNFYCLNHLIDPLDIAHLNQVDPSRLSLLSNYKD